MRAEVGVAELGLQTRELGDQVLDGPRRGFSAGVESVQFRFLGDDRRTGAGYP